jgi:undecaprenyl-diphosphatase
VDRDHPGLLSHPRQAPETGILGLALEHPIRVALAKPITAAVFLVVNGGILIGAERLRRRVEVRAAALRAGAADDEFRPLHTLQYREAGLLGLAQSGGLLPGISRDGMVMSAGLLRGLDNEDAARFSFLLATPIILAAGIFKIRDLTGPLGNGIRGEAVVAALCAAVAGIFSVHYLLRYFKTRNLVPFGIYCIIFGGTMIVYTAVS